MAESSSQRQCFASVAVIQDNPLSSLSTGFSERFSWFIDVLVSTFVLQLR